VSEKRLKHRRVATAVSVSAAVVLFATLGGAGLAQTALEPARGLVTQNQGGEKVEICHKGKNTISISVNALPAHLRHGDTESECAAVAGTTGAAKAKKGEKKQSTESAELPATETTKKSKAEKGSKGASAGGPMHAKLAKGKSKKKAAAGTSDETNVGPTTSSKPKKQKPPKSKVGPASPPGLGGAAPPGHGNAKGNGKNK
jgi:microcystin-dependent protein